MLVLLEVGWWAEPMEQPADRTSLQQYDVDDQVLARRREARAECLGARAALLRELDRQGFRAPPRPRDGGYVDIVFDRPPGPEAPRFIEVEDDERRSIRYERGWSATTGVGAAAARALSARADVPRRGVRVFVVLVIAALVVIIGCGVRVVVRAIDGTPRARRVAGRLQRQPASTGSCCRSHPAAKISR